MPVRRMRRANFMESPCQSDVNILTTVENLINMAMGPDAGNIINFKMLQAILHIFARQLRMMEQQVEVKIVAEPTRPKPKPPKQHVAAEHPQKSAAERAESKERHRRGRFKSKERVKSPIVSSSDDAQKKTERAKSKDKAEKIEQKDKEEKDKAKFTKMDEKYKEKYLKEMNDDNREIERERADRGRPDRKRADRERPDRDKSEREKADRERPDRERPDREKADKERPDREKTDREKEIIANLDENEKARFAEMDDKSRVKYLKEKVRKERENKMIANMDEKEKANFGELDEEERRQYLIEKENKDKETPKLGKIQETEKEKIHSKKKGKPEKEKDQERDGREKEIFSKVDEKGKEKYLKEEAERSKDQNEKKIFSETDEKGKTKSKKEKGGKPKVTLRESMLAKMDDTEKEKFSKMDEKGKEEYLKEKVKGYEKTIIAKMNDTEKEMFLNMDEKDKEGYLDEKQEEEEKVKSILAEMNDREKDEYAKLNKKEKEKYLKEKGEEKAILSKMDDKEKEEFAKMDKNGKEKHLKEKVKKRKEAILGKMDDTEKEMFAKMDENGKEKYLKKKGEEREKLEKMNEKEKEKFAKMDVKEKQKYLKDKEEEESIEATMDEEEKAKYAKMGIEEKKKYINKKGNEKREKETKRAENETAELAKIDVKGKEKSLKEEEKVILTKMNKKEKEKFLKMDEKGEKKFLEEKEREELISDAIDEKEKERRREEKEKDKRKKRVLEKFSKKEQEKFAKMDEQEKETYLNQKEREEREKDMLLKMDEKEKAKFAKMDEKSKQKYLNQKESEEKEIATMAKMDEKEKGKDFFIKEKDKRAAREKIGKDSGTRVGSIEVVTISQFELLEAQVKELQEKAAPIPFPSMPDNQKLRKDIAKGSASLTDTMQAMQVSARVQAAESAIGRMAGILTQLAAAGALPKDVAGLLENVTAHMGISDEGHKVYGSKGIGSSHGGAWRDSAIAGAQSAEPSALPSDIPKATVIISRGDFDKALRGIRDELIKNAIVISTKTLKAAETASATATKVLEKIETLSVLHNRVDDLYGLVSDYSNQLAYFDAGVTSQMENFNEQMRQMRQEIQEAVNQLISTSGASESEAVQELHSRFEDLVAGLDITLHSHNKLNTYQNQLSNELKSLLECVEMLHEEKADRDEVLDGLQDKADISRLAGLLTEKAFAIVHADLEHKLAVSYGKFLKQDRMWMKAMRDLSLKLREKSDLVQLLTMKNLTEEELRKIQQELILLTKALGDPKAALLTRQLSIGALCGPCGVPALQETTDPCASQPASLPPLRRYRPMEPVKSCETLTKPPPSQQGERLHVCHRWVGGSHTLLSEGVVRKLAGPPQSGPPLKKYAGLGIDGRLYRLEETLDPCMQCNKINSLIVVKMDATGDSVKKTNVQLDTNKNQ